MTAKTSVAEWERRVTQYEGVIAGFEQTRADLLKRRTKAADSVIVLIDEQLKLNDRMLNSMRQGLKSAQDEISRLRAKD